MWTAIPLTSKHKDDNYYFHYDLKDKKLGTARIENLINIVPIELKNHILLKIKLLLLLKKIMMK